MLCVCENFLFCDVFANLLELCYLKELQQELGITLYTHKDTNYHCVVTKIDLVRP